MPELAEVEFYRRKWNAGCGAVVTNVHLHGEKRIFRGVEPGTLVKAITGAKLVSSAAHGKQMAFRFTRGVWLGIHLGMTGELLVEAADFTPRKHDHLVLFQRKQALVFSDPRQFGRVLFFQGSGEPDWWRDLPPQILSREFSLRWMAERLARHRKLPLKAALLDQSTFAGIGNWMADEILWQARFHPRTTAGALDKDELKNLWQTTRSVTRKAVSSVAKPSASSEFSDPPKGFLFHVRWRRGGKCPRDGGPLRHETIGGRTTAYCPKCQGA